jgi:malate dehydrogenase (oxaloacetate-decarboxylating)
MKVAATKAIANLIADEDLREDYVVPEAFDKRVAPAVAAAVAKAAIETGVARVKIDPEVVRANTMKRLAAQIDKFRLTVIAVWRTTDCTVVLFLRR